MSVLQQALQAEDASGTSTTSNNNSSVVSSSAPNDEDSWLPSMPGLARKLLAVSSAAEVAEALVESNITSLTEKDAKELLLAALDKSNTALAMSMHSSMYNARRQSSRMPSSFQWPAASTDITTSLVLGLCKQLAINEACQVIGDIRVQGLPRNEEVGFGKVIGSPLAPGRTLTVVQPHEGYKIVADAFSKYEFEVFSGTVTSCSSEALAPSNSLLYSVGRQLGILRIPPVAAVHEYVVTAPDGTSRTFRVGTASAEVPAQQGERVTFVCSPTKASNKRRGLLAPSPPGTKPGQALSAVNHNTGAMMSLLAPPVSGTQTGSIPSWYLPAAMMLAGTDVASSLVNPAMPAMLAAGAAVVVSSAVAGNTMLIPRLKQLPDKSLEVEYIRQRLLGQYAALADRVQAMTSESNEDVRVLAKLWQLQIKMESISGGAAYQARITRVSAARSSIEERLSKRLELLDGYSRVMKMIEIEVEMDTEVPAAELAGIEMQIDRLQELESLQTDWRAQAEAQDEVEKLLRAA